MSKSSISKNKYEHVGIMRKTIRTFGVFFDKYSSYTTDKNPSATALNSQ